MSATWTGKAELIAQLKALVVDFKANGGSLRSPHRYMAERRISPQFAPDNGGKRERAELESSKISSRISTLMAKKPGIRKGA